ncbi:MAG: hypothetical protein SAL07_14075 [Oscillatoria sp. PMC 1051.18]|nr:hypothetical protein [Oscillatoria sp. PMC 1051.18]
MSRKPNFKEMSLQELKSYVLNHRNDSEAWKEFASRPRPNAIHFDSNMSISEQKAKLQSLLES